MRMLQAALILTAAFVYANEAMANSLSTAKAVRNADSVHSFENVFGDLRPSSKIMLKKEFNNAPAEIQTAVANNYRTYHDGNYFKIGSDLNGDGRSAVTIAPNSNDNVKSASVTFIQTGNGQGHSYDFTMSHPGNPKTVEIPYFRDYQENLHIPEAFGVPVGGFKSNSVTYVSTDTIRGVPIKYRTHTHDAEIIESKVVTVMKVGNEDRRFTLQAGYTSDPKIYEGMERGRWVTEADGSREYYNNPDYFNVRVKVKRDSPDAPLDRLDIAVNFREMIGHTTFPYRLPPAKNGKPRQIQDVKLSEDPKTKEITMEVIATDGEVLTYKIERNGDKAKMTKSKEPYVLENMAEYGARKRAITARQVTEADGAGAKGIEEAVEAGR